MIGDSEPLGGYPAYQGLKGRREAERGSAHVKTSQELGGRAIGRS